MRTKGTENTQMVKDLMAAYRRVVDKYDFRDQIEAYYKTVNEPAPKFYVSPRRAIHIILPMLHGDMTRVDSLRPLKKAMYMELFSKVVMLSGQWNFQHKSLSHILSFAVNEPASRFYIQPDTMRKIYNDRGRYVR